MLFPYIYIYMYVCMYVIYEHIFIIVIRDSPYIFPISMTNFHDFPIYIYTHIMIYNCPFLGDFP